MYLRELAKGKKNKPLDENKKFSYTKRGVGNDATKNIFIEACCIRWNFARFVG